MNTFLGDGLSPLFLVMIFVAVVLLLEGLYLLWNTYQGPETKQLAQRLRTISASADNSPQSAVLKQRMLSEAPTLQRLLFSLPRMQQLDRFILQSGLTWTVSQVLLLVALAGLGSYVLLHLYGPRLMFSLQLAITITAALLPLLYVQFKRNRRLHKIEQQLPDALDLIGRALRAGHSFSSGLKMVDEEMTGPIAREFGMTHDEVNFGITLQQALTNLGQRIPLTDLRYFVIAVLIQRETGGNLTELLTNLSKLIRNRLQLHAKIRVLTAEGRISAWTLGLLPFALAGLMNLGNPDFISVLWKEPAGIQLTQITLFVMAVGGLWLWRLTKVRV
jgi:tight adherence protein B